MSDRDLFTRLCEIIDRQRVSEWQGGIHPEDVGHLARALIAAGVTMPAPKRQPERCTGPSGFGGLRCTKDVDHDGECW